MRSVVVRNLREALPRGEQPPQETAAPEINVCCHGQDAGDEVWRHVLATSVHEALKACVHCPLDILILVCSGWLVLFHNESSFRSMLLKLRGCREAAESVMTCSLPAVI